MLCSKRIPSAQPAYGKEGIVPPRSTLGLSLAFQHPFNTGTTPTRPTQSLVLLVEALTFIPFPSDLQLPYALFQNPLNVLP